MELKEIIARSFQFHRLAYLSITQKCPLTCRHCFVESSPFRNEAVSQPQIAAWLEGIAASGVDTLIVSGGEPFANPRVLSTILTMCHERGLVSVVGSSGYWAKTIDAGHRFLDRFPPIDFLFFSTDLFHEEFVSLPELRNAALVARARGIGIGFQLLEEKGESIGFLERFLQQVDPDDSWGDSLYFAPLGAEGRARRPADAPGATGLAAVGQIDDGPCGWLGAPWVHEDGATSACPNLDVHRDTTHPMHIGNLNQSSFADLSAQANASLYLQAMRTLGPRGIVEHFPVRELGLDLDGFAGTSVCDLCHVLGRSPGFPAKLEAHMIANGWQSRLTALRLLVYGEAPAHV